jgi:hypothetical protein
MDAGYGRPSPGGAFRPRVRRRPFAPGLGGVSQ